MHPLLLWLMLLGTPGMLLSQTPPDNIFTKDFLPVWERAQAFTIAVAEAMPEEKFSYQPTPEVFSFGEQIMHIAGNLHWLHTTYIQGKQLEFSKKNIFLLLHEHS